MPRRTPSLWTDRPDDWPDARAAKPDEPRTERLVTPPPVDEPASRRSSGGRRNALVVALAAAIAGTAGAVTYLALDESGTASPRSVATRSPAASGTTPTPLPATGGSLTPTPNARLYEQASRAVVSVRVRSASGEGSGTGFVIDDDGTIVTNAHVVADARTVEVRLDDTRDTVRAEVRGADPSTDLAVLQVDAQDVAGITPLQLADSDAVKVGDSALAIGYPLGLDRTATSGIVSGVGREIQAPNGFSIDKVIQTDAPINPGNSGGPLLDSGGRVIGVNSQIATAGGGGGNVGIGFAVPSNTVRTIVPRLLAGETIRRAYLGVSTSDAAGAGARVGEIVAGGPSDRAGLQVGDVVLSVGGVSVTRPDDVATAIADRAPGDSVDVQVRRAGDTRALRITLGTRPESTP